VGSKVANARANVKCQRAGVGKAIEGQGFTGVVGDLGADRNVGDVAENIFASGGKSRFRDIDGLVDDTALLTDGGAEKQTSLGRGACA